MLLELNTLDAAAAALGPVVLFAISHLYLVEAGAADSAPALTSRPYEKAPRFVAVLIGVEIAILGPFDAAEATTHPLEARRSRLVTSHSITVLAEHWYLSVGCLTRYGVGLASCIH